MENRISEHHVRLKLSRVIHNISSFPQLKSWIFIKPPNPSIYPVWAFKGQYQYSNIWLKCRLSSGSNVPMILSTKNVVSQTASNIICEVDHPDWHRIWRGISCTYQKQKKQNIWPLPRRAGPGLSPGLTYRSWAGQQSSDPTILQLDWHSHAHCSIGQSGQQSI